jgi:ADP-ribose pyrophosphatase
LEHGSDAWTLEPVGGVLNPGEQIEEALRREAMEEAGLEIQQLEHIATYHVSPGTAADRVRLFCGRVDAGKAVGIHGVGEEEEETRVKVIDANQAASALCSGEIDTSSAIIGTQWLALNRDRLRVEWNR